MATKNDPQRDADDPPKGKRDFAQRGYDTVREVERRHAERHPEEADEKPKGQ